MNPIDQKLFETYGETILRQIGNFPGSEVKHFLNSLPVEESRRIDLYDQAQRFYLQWSADAFVIGLHLGLSLVSDQIRRSGPEQS